MNHKKSLHNGLRAMINKQPNLSCSQFTSQLQAILLNDYSFIKADGRKGDRERETDTDRDRQTDRKLHYHELHFNRHTKNPPLGESAVIIWKTPVEMRASKGNIPKQNFSLENDNHK